MTWDSRTGEVLLFGGRTVPQNVDLSDTWKFDGTDWTQATGATSPAARNQHSFTHVTGTGVSVMFGGVANGTTLQDLWVWDGEEWQTPIAPTGTPTPREKGYIDAVAGLFSSADVTTQRARVVAYEGATELVASQNRNDVEARIFWALAIAQTALPSDKTFAQNLMSAAVHNQAADTQSL